MTYKLAALCLIPIALAGCASNPAVQSNQPNSLTVQINNEANGTMLMRGGSMHTYDSPRCTGEARQASKVSMANHEALTTVPVKPGVPLTFALTTLNAQSFKGNWGCSVTSTFTPVAGASYQATLQTDSENANCKVTVLDQNKNVVPTTTPDYSCQKTLAGIVKNGARYGYSPKIVVPVMVPR